MTHSIKISPILLLFLLLLSLQVRAQGISINNNGAAPDSSAMLDVSSVTKGVLISRMTTPQRDNIPNPALGLMIFNLTTNCINFHVGGGTWREVCGNCSPAPTTANAGPNQTGIASPATLAANTPVNGTGTWTITGPGDGNGLIANPNSPASTFSGTAGISYTLTWTITNPCGISSDSVTITFSANGKRVFVTSITYDGNLGGTNGANQKCMDRAAAAGMPGNFKAWVSEYQGPEPAITFTQSTTPYFLTNGTLIANNWADLTDGSISNPINRDEFGLLVGTESVWTQTQTNGTFNADNCCCAGGFHACGNWTTNVGGTSYKAQYGFTNRTNQEWTDYDVASGNFGCVDTHECRDCNCSLRIYCFEQ